MDIAYVTRSAFLEPCEAVIRRDRDILERGGSIEVVFDEGGYTGRITVEIREGDATGFGTDWENPDPTRFPARIKAAATALFNCRCYGRFQVEHADGRLTIQPA